MGSIEISQTSTVLDFFEFKILKITIEFRKSMFDFLQLLLLVLPKYEQLVLFFIYLLYYSFNWPKEKFLDFVANAEFILR